MSPELELLLYEEFPLLYRLRHLESPDMWCGWRGIDCGDGWYGLLRELSRAVSEHASGHFLDPMVRHVGGRGGLLYVNVEGADERILDLCGRASEKSSHVCEICGEPGGFSHSPPYEIRVCCPKHVVEKDCRPLSPDETSRLRHFNEKARELQREIVSEGRRQVEMLTKRVADPLDPLDDFEIRARVSFRLRSSDPDYRDDDDNILTIRCYCISKNLAETPHFDLIEDWWVGDGHFGVENHSYILHDLCNYFHGPGKQQLSPRDILRIGCAWIDIEIEAQMLRDFA